MKKQEPVWRYRAFLVALALIPVAMITIDGPLSAVMRPVGSAIKPVIDALAEGGDSKYTLVPAGLAAIFLMLLYFVDPSTLRARLYAWLAGASGFIFISVAYSGILTNVIKLLVGRARPYRAEALNWPEFHLLPGAGALHSFPSGHANTVFAIALAVGFLAPPLRRWLLALAVVIGFCRVLQFQHFVSDTLGGALLAVVTTYWLRDCFARAHIVFRKESDGRVTFVAPGRFLARLLRRFVGRKVPVAAEEAVSRQPAA